MTSETNQESKKRLSLPKSAGAFFGYGLLAGVLILLIIRFFMYGPQRVHYHANFAAYINGTRQTFNDPTYYEDVSACAADSAGITAPQERAHMHSNVNDVIHVHDHAVTWGAFFTNIGWYVSDSFLKTRTNLYVADDTNKVNVILNGQDYTGVMSIANTVIKDQDKLLVSYGNIDSTTLQHEYNAIQNNALTHDKGKDPSTCSSGAPVTLSQRLHHLF